MRHRVRHPQILLLPVFKTRITIRHAMPRGALQGEARTASAKELHKHG